MELGHLGRHEYQDDFDVVAHVASIAELWSRCETAECSSRGCTTYTVIEKCEHRVGEREVRDQILDIGSGERRGTRMCIASSDVFHLARLHAIVVASILISLASAGWTCQVFEVHK